MTSFHALPCNTEAPQRVARGLFWWDHKDPEHVGRSPSNPGEAERVTERLTIALSLFVSRIGETDQVLAYLPRTVDVQVRTHTARRHARGISAACHGAENG